MLLLSSRHDYGSGQCTHACCLREKQAALEAAAAERDKLLPQVEESKWRARQLERERDMHAARAQDLAQVELVFDVDGGV